MAPTYRHLIVLLVVVAVCWWVLIETSFSSNLSWMGDEKVTHFFKSFSIPANGRRAYCLESNAERFTGVRKFGLVAQVFVRIYDDDLSGFVRRDLLHWLTYMRYAGVEHVYLYDAWHHREEKLEDILHHAIGSRFVTYLNWHNHAVRYLNEKRRREKEEGGDIHMLHTQMVQIPSKEHCWSIFGHQFEWIMLLDIDEYPLVVGDEEEGFLQRFLKKNRPREKGFSAFLLSNYIMYGPRNRTKGPMVLQQIPLVTINPANNLHKPLIYAPDATSFSVVHHAHVRGLVWPHPSLKMMHLRHGRYNIPGRQNWGAIPPEIVQQVEPANMQYLAKNVLQCFTGDNS